MVVRIRLSRLGCKNRPFYRVMAADSRSPRDGKHLEVLGYYNPLPGQDGGKRMGLNFDRVKSTIFYHGRNDPLNSNWSLRIGRKGGLQLGGDGQVQDTFQMIAGTWDAELICKMGGRNSMILVLAISRCPAFGAGPATSVSNRVATPTTDAGYGSQRGPRDTRPIDPMTGRYLTHDKPANADQPKDSEGDGDGATAS
ncbi:ribosomal protein S16 family protein [Actinidia rufa]|uniref:Ribosomal protein S16 family protein n=1 Tax=Actinidia rufa TaxID=165716 RepID=A0A7J0E2W1_9ERIC|nr:ribosomal protein S16 family protein [Actinidia rufa]